MTLEKFLKKFVSGDTRIAITKDCYAKSAPYVLKKQELTFGHIEKYGYYSVYSVEPKTDIEDNKEYLLITIGS